MFLIREILKRAREKLFILNKMVYTIKKNQLNIPFATMMETSI